jgi:hypothetical protein
LEIFDSGDKIREVTGNNIPILYSARTKKRIFCQGQNQYLGKIKILTAGIHEVFRGLKFLVDADIGKKGLFRSGTI